MEREGEVIAVQGENLVVQFCRPTDCEKCHGCMGGSAQRQLLVHAIVALTERKRRADSSWQPRLVRIIPAVTPDTK